MIVIITIMERSKTLGTTVNAGGKLIPEGSTTHSYDKNANPHEIMRIERQELGLKVIECSYLLQ